jgi:hypothetical protein
MMMNCMGTGTGMLTIGGVRLAEVAHYLTLVLLAVLTAIAAIAVVRLGFDVAGRLRGRPLPPDKASSMRTKRPGLMRSRTEAAVSALAIVSAITVGAVALGHDSFIRPSISSTDRGGTEGMGMMSDDRPMKGCRPQISGSVPGADERRERLAKDWPELPRRSGAGCSANMQPMACSAAITSP